MAQVRTICCDVCGLTAVEKTYGAGFPGWGGLIGVAVTTDDGREAVNPDLCPEHKARVAEFVGELMEGK